jgi:O-antigen/teichoic acid export membrane protein
MVSLFPLLSRYEAEEPSKAEWIVLLAYRYSYLIICPVSLVLIVYPEGVLGALFGSRFSEAGTGLAVLAVAEVFAFSNAVTYNVLLARNRQRETAYIAGGSLIVNVTLNLWLIPKGGITGAAAASLGSYAAIPILALLVPRIRSVGVAALRTLCRPVVAMGMTAAVLWSVSPRPLVGVLLIMVAYPVAAMIVGCFGVKDLRLFAREVVGSRTS